MSKKSRTFADKLSNSIMNNSLLLIGAGIIGYYIYQLKSSVSDLKEKQGDSALKEQFQNQYQDDRLSDIEDRLALQENKDGYVIQNLKFYPGVKACNTSYKDKFNGNFYFTIANESVDYRYHIKKFRAQITLNNHVIKSYQPGWIGDFILGPGDSTTIWCDSFSGKWFDPEVASDFRDFLDSHAGTYIQSGLMANISVLIGTANGGERIVDYNGAMGNLHCYSKNNSNVWKIGQRARYYNAVDNEDFKDLL